VELEFNTFNERTRAGRFDAIMGALAIDPVPSGIRQLWTAAGVGGTNYGAYVNPTFDSLVTSAIETREQAAARRLWHRALETINDDAPAVWLFTPSLGAAVNARVWNVTIRPDLWSAFLWEWRVTDSE
jgi:peptide/nickel transport system substrate-binding protein